MKKIIKDTWQQLKEDLVKAVFFFERASTMTFNGTHDGVPEVSMVPIKDIQLVKKTEQQQFIKDEFVVMVKTADSLVTIRLEDPAECDTMFESITGAVSDYQRSWIFWLVAKIVDRFFKLED